MSVAEARIPLETLQRYAPIMQTEEKGPSCLQATVLSTVFHLVSFYAGYSGAFASPEVLR